SRHLLYLYSFHAHRDLHSFPTRRSSDLRAAHHHSDEPQTQKQIVCSPALKRPGFVCPRYDVDESRQSAGEAHDEECLLEHGVLRSEEHTSELQSRGHLVCRLLLEKKKNK